MEKNSQKVEKLKIVLKHFNFEKNKDLAKAISMSPGYISEIFSGKKDVPKTMGQKLEDRLSVSRKWFDLDEGEMLVSKPEQKTSISRIEAKPVRLVDPFGLEATGQKFYTLADGSEVMQIPVVPVKAYGSYLRGYADPEFYEGFDTITIPVDKLHKGNYMAFDMEGESMVNIETKEMARKALWPGQRVIGRDLQRSQWQYKLHIHSTEAWIIVHKTDGIVVKEITEHNINTGEITLHSWNPDKSEYPDYKINLDDVQQLFNVIDPYKKMKA